ncbi:sporulation integral membrane protein YtvI [Paenibacillus sp. 1001270B_150601_E10]|uniref:sporulation integral membrane protein YtvI n=1 Tax=Paenibacillus sp. 1001270B_150601_E10 TaxID=2787079 RepID=UPI00189D142D|nr:sporulation integral membrane protein YtvI [Paenibacillus sp. 1001270B_150601_E10]
MNAVKWSRISRCLLILFVTIGVLAGIYILVPLLYPFILAWLIALMMNPLVNGMQHVLRFPRWLSVTVALGLFFSAMLTITAAAITRIVKEIISLSFSIQDYLDQWRELFIQILQGEEVQSFILTINSLYSDNPNLQETINSNISRTAETVTNTITSLVSGLLNSIVLILSSLPNIATITVVVLLAAFFISKDWKRWLQLLKDTVPKRIRKPIKSIWVDLQKAMFGYLRAQFILISITAVVITIGLMIIGIDYAVTIGLLIGIVDLLPYLGVGAVMVPWIAYCFIAGDVSIGIGLSILYGIVLVARQVMEPKVLASSVGLDPLLTLIAMFVGLKLFGVLGLIIGPVSLVMGAAIHRANIWGDLHRYIIYGRR